MQIVLLIILFLYVLLIVNYAIGWKQNAKSTGVDFYPKVSVIIAMRNEEAEILRLLSELKKQIYPTDKLEFILVNDHSTDATLALLEQEKMDNLQIVNMIPGEFGKKNAIAKAVQLAKGEIILASDADCSFTPYWVKTMASYFADENVKLVSGPVSYHKQKGVFQSLQTLEFVSLIASGAGAIGVANPIFCNGANMAYRTATFIELNNFENDTAASGDDVFLLHSIKAKYTKSIAFANDSNATVLTDAVPTMKGFINQRKRWTAKSSGYKDRASIYASFLVLFVNLALFFLFVMHFLSADYFKLFILFYSIKSLVDVVLLYPALTFFNRKDLLKWIFPFEIFYSFYIVLIVVLSFTNTFEWKGRIHNK
jgi:cellulose synthase/poly-beta-1,6-N-acetylglucosamine synthase-like glycosyltransferase